MININQIPCKFIQLFIYFIQVDSFTVYTLSTWVDARSKKTKEGREGTYSAFKELII